MCQMMRYLRSTSLHIEQETREDLSRLSPRDAPCPPLYLSSKISTSISLHYHQPPSLPVFSWHGRPFDAGSALLDTLPIPNSSWVVLLYVRARVVRTGLNFISYSFLDQLDFSLPPTMNPHKYPPVLLITLFNMTVFRRSSEHDHL